MSQVTGPIVINDGQATPVAKTFAVAKVSPESSSFEERTSGVAAGYKVLSIRTSRASAKRPTHRVDIDLDFPVLSTVNGVSSLAYTGRVRSYFVIPDQMTAAERADIQAFFANALDNAIVKATVKDLDPPY